MKIRPLPETDLARIAPMPRDEKRRALLQQKEGWSPYSYLPARLAVPDILNTQYDLLPPSSPTPWAQVHSRVLHESRSTVEFENNLAVSAALYAHAQQQSCFSRHRPFGTVSTSIADPLRYWLDLVVTFQDRSFIPFFDPRRGKRLTARGRRFVFSMMHENIRVRDPDYAGLDLRIFQFSSAKDQPRELRIFSSEGEELYTFDELNEMIQETYDMWSEILFERTAKRRASGGAGPLI
ncbi:hypothetical protein JQ604_10485 [Bradyrhizobium jicamae]|uniref:type VI toxin-antitoxin system SocB family DNA replication inhibitor toxin n=1 Tax=Bradyrhizobium jicamae TaxID=280332 RepID=UPI001BABF6CF|nr:hypothetical protein [Bradyrhizobium jicamae]MBR0752611.1 hypothetical protein [Bradyrhizobium jicamae]